MLLKSLVATALTASAVFAAAGFAPAAAPAPARAVAADVFKVDSAHSSVTYRIKHLNVSYHHGRFDQVEGTFLLDQNDPSSSSISLSVPADSINSNHAGRDKHLKTPDFFSAKEFPTITFKSTEVTKKGEANGETAFEVTGDLTLLGKTKPVTAEVRLTGQGPGMKGGEVAGLETTFVIKRSDFGMNYMVGKGLGDDVTITVALEGGRS